MFRNIIVLLDESGSMFNVKDETIKMINSFLHEQKIKNSTSMFSMYLFGTNIRSVCENVNIQNVPQFTDYYPKGATLLYDTIGQVIVHYQHTYDTIVLIITDGEDNLSKLYTPEKVRELVLLMQREKGWTFFFFGATDELVEQARLLGMRTYQTFDTTKDGLDELSQQMSRMVLSLY